MFAILRPTTLGNTLWRFSYRITLCTRVHKDILTISRRVAPARIRPVFSPFYLIIREHSDIKSSMSWSLDETPAISALRDTVIRYKTTNLGANFWIEFTKDVSQKARDFVVWFMENEIQRHHNYVFHSGHFGAAIVPNPSPQIAVNRIKSYKLVNNIAHIDYEPLPENDPFPHVLELLRSEAKRIEYQVGVRFQYRN